MRVTTSFFVSALVRRYFAAGAMAVIRHHGADEAGAVFIVLDRLEGTVDLYAPAPQSMFATGRPDERRFQRVGASLSPLEVSERLQRELRFDPDAWFVDVEDRDGRLFFDIEPE